MPDRAVAQVHACRDPGSSGGSLRLRDRTKASAPAPRGARCRSAARAVRLSGVCAWPAALQGKGTFPRRRKRLPSPAASAPASDRRRWSLSKPRAIVVRLGTRLSHTGQLLPACAASLRECILGQVRRFALHVEPSPATAGRAGVVVFIRMRSVAVGMVGRRRRAAPNRRTTARWHGRRYIGEGRTAMVPGIILICLYGREESHQRAPVAEFVWRCCSRETAMTPGMKSAGGRSAPGAGQRGLLFALAKPAGRRVIVRGFSEARVLDRSGAGFPIVIRRTGCGFQPSSLLPRGFELKSTRTFLERSAVKA